MNRRVVGTSAGAVLIFALAGCGGGSSAPKVVNSEIGTQLGALTVHVIDVTDMPISDAAVDVTASGVQRQATTGADGIAEFADLPTGKFAISVSADGFDPATSTDTLGPGLNHSYYTLRADREWAAGRAIVLGTRIVERANDGSTMTFSVDMAVVGESSEAIETLTAAHFDIVPGSCGWGHRISCAYDSGYDPSYAEEGAPVDSFHSEDGPLAFEWIPSATRHPYLVGVLVQRRDSTFGLDQKLSALKSFFTVLGGNDIASLASVQTENGTETLTELGPFTSDGNTYLEAINNLARPAGIQPTMMDSLTEYVRRVAAADAGGNLGVERTVLLLASPGQTYADFTEPTALAVSLGVRVSYVGYFDLVGFRDVAARTGGFESGINDPRGYGLILGAMDQLLSGTMPFYRIQFRIQGTQGTFESGRTATLFVQVHVPTSFPSSGIGVPVDIMIP